MRSKHKGLVVIIILVITVLSALLLYREGTLPVDKTNKETQIFVISRGEGLVDITRKLHQEELIRNRLVFYLVVKQLGIEKKIQAGDFRLSPSMNAYQIAKALTHGTIDVWVTIIEGLRNEEIAEVVSDDLNIPAIEFIKAAEGKEGQLFPDTYLIPRKATAETVIGILTKNFETKFSDEIRIKAQSKGLTQDEAVVLASIVEREAKFAEDRPKVASVLLRRLNEGIPLQADATVQYALGYQAEEKSWWKQNTTLDDLKVGSPYNTYQNAGLPPGPISNPGFASIEAVAKADSNTPFLYYLSDKKGKMHFAQTLEEHQKNIDRYLK